MTGPGDSRKTIGLEELLRERSISGRVGGRKYDDFSAYRHPLRGGTLDEVGTVAALLMGPDGAFITGSHILMDGGVSAAYWYGETGFPND